MWSVEAMKARSVAQLLVGGFDEVWERQRARMNGLTQEEYVWEPVPDCWAVTERDGVWRVPEHERPDPVPAPVTTIGWRMWHIEWGPFAPEPWAALVVHALDEVAHHGAEIGLLRDLYAHRQSG